MEKEVLLQTLDELTEDEFKCFKWFLKDERLKDVFTIPKNKLENARTYEIVDLMIQNCGTDEAVDAAVWTLEKINRRDLAEKFESGQSVKVR